MIKVTYEDQLNISTDLIEYLLALIKITNKGSALLQEQVDYSTVSQTIEAIRENICECAQKYRIVKELNPDIFKNLLNCYDLPVCDHKLIQLCDLLLLFKRAESVKFVLETNDRQTLKADEKSFIENVIQEKLFQYLKEKRKLEEYTSLLCGLPQLLLIALSIKRIRISIPMLLITRNLSPLTRVIFNR